MALLESVSLIVSLTVSSYQGLVSRSYRLHVPKHWPLDNNQPLPLLLDFHGWTQHAGARKTQTKFETGITQKVLGSIAISVGHEKDVVVVIVISVVVVIAVAVVIPSKPHFSGP